MPHTRGAKKAVRQNEKNRARNRTIKKSVKVHKRACLEAIKEEDFEGAIEELAVFYKRVDKAAAKGPIHRNKAARLKSRMAKKINAARTTAEKASSSKDGE